MKNLGALLTFLFLSMPMAAEPGHRLTWEDVAIRVRGLKTAPFLSAIAAEQCGLTDQEGDTAPDFRCFRSPMVQAVDADGSVYFIARLKGDGPRGIAGSAVWRTRKDGSTEQVASIAGRSAPGSTRDLGAFVNLAIDLVHGELYVTLNTSCYPPKLPGGRGHRGPQPESNCTYGSGISVFRMIGLTGLTK